MRRCSSLLLVGCLFWAAQLLAQSLPDDSDPDPTRWINYRQTYIKVPVSQPGLYRITSMELERAGFPIGSIDHPTLQLFHRGIEQAIHVTGETDKRLGATGYVEFYGQGNDGVPDSLLYREAGLGTGHPQPHSHYSLFSDTTAYFLTWRLDGKPGRRMQTYTDTSGSNLTPETYHWAEELRLFTDTYPGYPNGIPPKIEYSYFEAGEGYTGPIQQRDVPYTNLFVAANAFTGGPAPQIDMLLVGRNYTNHRVDCQIGVPSGVQRLISTVNFSGYDNASIHQFAQWTDVDAAGRLLVSTVSRDNTSSTDQYSVSYIRLRYPQQLTASNQPVFRLRPAVNPVGRSLLTVRDVPASTRFLDITDPNAPVWVGTTTLAPGTIQLVVQGTDTERTLWCSSQPSPVAFLRPVTFTNWTNRRPTYLIISHEALMQSTAGGSTSNSSLNAVQQYAAYRASAAGGLHDTLTATVQQLFDQYSYGERHPLAIRRFTSQLLRQSIGSAKRPQFLLLLGRSRSTPGVRHNPIQATLDLVPTYGFPGSDVLFTTGLDGQPQDVPAIPTGRINAGAQAEIMNYLDKVKEHEALPAAALWRKQILHLSGGETSAEAAFFRWTMNTFRDITDTHSLGARVTTISKETDNPVERIDVAKPINEGVGLVTFFGHSGLDVTDLDIGFCSNDALGYRNKGKYPLLLINGCALGNFYFGRPTLTADWVLTPNRGAIAAIAQSHLGYPDVLARYSTTFYTLLADSLYLSQSIGQLQQETIRRVLAHTPNGLDLANTQQMVLQGDPAIRLFPFQTPDYVLTASNIQIQAAGGQPLTVQSDSVQIRIIVQNAGQYRTGKLPVRIRRLVNGSESAVYNLVLPRTIAFSDTLILTLPNEQDAEGQNLFDITINPVGASGAPSLPETNLTNNQATVAITVAGQQPVLIYPAVGSTVKTQRLRLVAHSFRDGSQPYILELDTTSLFNSPNLVSSSVNAGQTISHEVNLSGTSPTTYFWRVYATGTVPSVKSTASFFFDPGSSATGLPEGQTIRTEPPTDIRQGDRLTIPIAFTNLSPYPFADSLTVSQTLYAVNLPIPQSTNWRIKAVAPGDTVRFFTRLDTKLLPGANRLLLTVNPGLQPESSFLNNTLDFSLPVQPDVLGPLLDVAFDGARITDNSVVSAQPDIDILVADDNRSLIRADTVGLNLFLQRPGTTTFSRLNWQKAIVQPTGDDNAFRIRLSSPHLTAGAYRLLVTARDVLGNSAVPYQVRFRVIDNPQLSSFTAYPNPFHDQTRFAFSLTGNQPPDSLALLIYDLNSHVVRHLSTNPSTLAKAGLPVRIGLNEWVWDGRTDSGELLPAGVYIYKLFLAGSPDWNIINRTSGHLQGRIVLGR